MKTKPRAGDLRDELGITEPSEICVEAIAQHCGATVLYERLDGCEAQILGMGRRAFITVNSCATRARQRFSVAHELGHWAFDRGRIATFSCADRAFVSEWFRDKPEARANRYAADLLLPERMFKADVRGREMTFETASELARRYETSLTSTTIRLVELGSYPAMLVCTDQGNRRWFVRGPDVPPFVLPVERVSADTLADDLLRNRPSVGPADVAADLWIDHTDAGRYVIREDSRAARNFVLTLLWWQDERQLVDLFRQGE